MLKISLELFFHFLLLDFHLSPVEVLHLLASHSLFLLLLLLGYCEFLISDLPEFSELLLLNILLLFLLLLSLNLLLSTSLNGLFHLESPSLLFFK